MKSVKLAVLTAMSVVFLAGVVYSQDEGEFAPSSRVDEKKAVPELREVVVTATKSEISRKETGASITIITGDEIEKKGNKMVADALKTVPGLGVTRQGMMGGISSVFMRGAAPRNLLVLIDGVRVNDPSTPDGAYNFADLLSDNIDRIEVIRGAMSTLYGSDATAGVINIVTKRGVGKNTLTVSAEGGSFTTFREYAGFHGGDEKANYSFSLSRTDSKGISQSEKADGALKAPERDGYENTTATANIGGAVSESFYLSMALRYIDARADIDDWAFRDDPNNIQRTRQMSCATAIEHDVTDGWSHMLLLHYMGVLRNTIDRADPVDPNYSSDFYIGSQRRLEWRNSVKIGRANVITAGIEYQDEVMSSLSDFSGSSSSFGEEKMHSFACYAQDHLKLFDRVYLIGGLRITDHEVFGRQWDYQISGSVIVPLVETRLKGNYATGFKAPSLYQLNVDDAFVKGNRNLKPEESRSFDLGLEQPLFSGVIVLEGSFFGNRYRNLITGEGSPYEYLNKLDAETAGYEAAVSILPMRELKIIGSYTYLGVAKEEGADGRMGRMVRRPKHQGSINANLSIFSRVNINAGLIYAGKRGDLDFTSWPEKRVEMDPYLAANAAVSVIVTEYLTLFARCENITDEEYQEVLGYRRPGRAMFGGVKGTF